MRRKKQTNEPAFDRAEAPESREELRRRRKKRSRRRFWRRVGVLAALVALVAVLWNHWDTLAPDKLLAQLQDSMNNTAGSYPVDVSGSNVQALVQCQSYTVTLSDSYLTYYSSSGSELARYGCTYSTPLLCTAGKYALVAEQEGHRWQLHTRSMTLVESTASQSILAAAVNEKGQVALLTQGGQGYTVELSVYDRKGTLLYTRSRNRQAVGVALSPTGSQVALLSVEAVNGVLNSVVEAFSVTSEQTEALYAYTVADTLLLRVDYLSGERLVALGEQGCWLLDEATAASPKTVTLAGQRVLGYATTADGFALAVRNYGDTGGGEVLVVNGRGEECVREAFEGNFRHLSGGSKGFLLLADGYVQSLSYSAAGKRVPVDADGQRAVRVGGNAVVLGLSVLQSYSLNG